MICSRWAVMLSAPSPTSPFFAARASTTAWAESASCNSYRKPAILEISFHRSTANPVRWLSFSKQKGSMLRARTRNTGALDCDKSPAVDWPNSSKLQNGDNNTAKTILLKPAIKILILYFDVVPTQTCREDPLRFLSGARSNETLRKSRSSLCVLNSHFQGSIPPRQGSTIQPCKKQWRIKT